MLLSRNVVESKFCCVGVALCRNGVMSCVVFVNGKLSGVEQLDNLSYAALLPKQMLLTFMIDQ